MAAGIDRAGCISCGRGELPVPLMNNLHRHTRNVVFRDYCALIDIKGKSIVNEKVYF